MASNTNLYQALFAAFELDGTTKVTNEAAAAALADVLSAFAVEISEAFQRCQNHFATFAPQCFDGAFDPALRGEDKQSAGASQGHPLDAGRQAAQQFHPATNDVYATGDYPLDGCTAVIKFISGTWTMGIYRPGVVPPLTDAIETYADRELSCIGTAVHQLVHGRSVAS